MPKPAPIRFAPLDELAFNALVRKWQHVRETLRRAHLGHVAVALEGTEPREFVDGRLALWFPDASTAHLFAQRAETYEAATAQAIFMVTGLHCGLLPVTGAGENE